MYTLLLIIFIVDVLIMIPVILMQSGTGADAGMFGSNLTLGAFGAKSNEVLNNFTKWLVIIFFASTLLMGLIKVREVKAYTAVSQQQNVQETPAQGEGTPTKNTPVDQQAPLESK